MKHNRLACIILAAGQGTRMRSNCPKVLTFFENKTIIGHVIEKAKLLETDQVVVVVSPSHIEEFESKFGNHVTFAIQENPFGTGDAFLAGLKKINNDIQEIIVLCGDTPLIQEKTLTDFANLCRISNSEAGLITSTVENPKMYGRIIRNSKNEFEKIVEWKDAKTKEKEIKEINSGMYFFQIQTIKNHISKINNNNASGEFYLTDVFTSIQSKNGAICTFPISGEEEILGINTKKDLSQALKISNSNRLDSFMVNNGVTIIDTASTFIGPDVTIGKDTVVKPNTWIEGEVSIGENCDIGPFVCIRGIKDRITILNGCTVGPFTSLREGCLVKDNAKVGTFVEMKKTQLGENAKANHLSYLGDSIVGARSNIGAGTITCNYDGYEKHKTYIGEDVFIGSDTIIVAPITINNRSYTGAGSVITKDVQEDTLAVSRSAQRNIENWVSRYKEKRELRRKK
ncbi:MAG: bifunctional UDP-N-acetylglucosamine diphosphorylase/glucosamine-1-phosphate N-acetyltransferase GlmU [Caldisericia bacterium]|nr:bifunctional UDP-N-acetylglucosamine diphosphorylase/glucosamine-1-phosphate N-acetyltransferase GlmU [Caldisericia bacterium]